MRERIARAVADPGKRAGYRGDRTLSEWVADAVLDTIDDAGLVMVPREPAEAMVEAGARVHDHWSGEHSIGAHNARRNVKQILRAAIDSAKGEQKP